VWSRVKNIALKNPLFSKNPIVFQHVHFLSHCFEMKNYHCYKLNIFEWLTHAFSLKFHINLIVEVIQFYNILNNMTVILIKTQLHWAVMVLCACVTACYVSKCVQSFVTCARQSGSEDVFGACKMLHKMCAASCSKGGSDDFLSLWPAMATARLPSLSHQRLQTQTSSQRLALLSNHAKHNHAKPIVIYYTNSN